MRSCTVLIKTFVDYNECATSGFFFFSFSFSGCAVHWASVISVHLPNCACSAKQLGTKWLLELIRITNYFIYYNKGVFPFVLYYILARAVFCVEHRFKEQVWKTPRLCSFLNKTYFINNLSEPKESLWIKVHDARSFDCCLRNLCRLHGHRCLCRLLRDILRREQQSWFTWFRCVCECCAGQEWHSSVDPSERGSSLKGKWKPCPWGLLQKRTTVFFAETFAYEHLFASGCVHRQEASILIFSHALNDMVTLLTTSTLACAKRC